MGGKAEPVYEIELACVRFDSGLYKITPVSELMPGPALDSIQAGGCAEIAIPYKRYGRVWCLTCHLLHLPNMVPAVTEVSELSKLAPEIVREFRQHATLMAGEPEAEPAGPDEVADLQVIHEALDNAPDMPIVIDAIDAIGFYHLIGIACRHPHLSLKQKGIGEQIMARILVGLVESGFDGDVETLAKPPSPEALAVIFDQISQVSDVFVGLTAMEAFVIIGHLMLATRHPDLPPLQFRLAVTIGQQLQQGLVERTGDDRLHRIIGYGWNPDLDVNYSGREADSDQT